MFYNLALSEEIEWALDTDKGYALDLPESPNLDRYNFHIMQTNYNDQKYLILSFS